MENFENMKHSKSNVGLGFKGTKKQFNLFSWGLENSYSMEGRQNDLLSQHGSEQKYFFLQRG